MHRVDYNEALKVSCRSRDYRGGRRGGKRGGMLVCSIHVAVVCVQLFIHPGAPCMVKDLDSSSLF